MADPICRWRNSSIKQLMEFNSLFPFGQKFKTEGRSYVEKLWGIIGGEDFFTTPYQLAAQMGVYYEDNTFLYPRFNKLISIEEAASYMLNWGKNYYSPNPYTKSIKNVRPVVINKFLVNYAQTIQNPKFSNALKEMFGDNVIGNTDILKNMLNTFSEVNIDKEDIVSIKYNVLEKLYNDEEIYPSVDVNDKKAFFEHFGRIESIKSLLFRSSNPLQQIYYGAPGTGKSHATNNVTSKYPDTVRTTFHPDSDYSTFVGAYKPTMSNPQKRYELDGNHKVFAMQYPEGDSKIGFICETKIEYKFVKQAFLKAYVKAWKLFKDTCVEGGELSPQFLVIEEINRGNCAQIFGDLFQLLDRKQNFSEYPVEADADICKALLEEDTENNPSFGAGGLQLTDEQKAYINNVYDGKPVAEKICNGQVLVLPPNLYIWATMNTSDQSLFPIDSAFKRRWEWKYMKIKEGKDKNGNKLDWKIVVKDKDGSIVKIKNEESLSWWSFIQKINAIIASMTSSADKQLGYFFCKADKDGIINGETFVSKVIFYLWNDVFKDYGFEDASLFRYKVKEGEKELEKDLTFPDFYDEDGENVNAERLVDFIQKVMAWQKPEENA